MTHSSPQHTPGTDNPTEGVGLLHFPQVVWVTSILVLLVLALAVIVGLGLCVIRIQLQVKHRYAQREYEMAKGRHFPQHRSNVPALEMSIPTYGGVETSGTQMRNTVETTEVGKSSNEYLGSYDKITLETATVEDSTADIPLDEPTYETVDRSHTATLKASQQMKLQHSPVGAGPVVPTVGSPHIYSQVYVRDVKDKQMPQSSPSDSVDLPAESTEIYSQVHVREVPAVPAKSSDLLEYLDRQSALDVGVYSEHINQLDFTRNRMEGGESDPQFLPPIYTAAPALSESYQDPVEVTSENITEKEKLGSGQFGEVVVANTNGLSLKSMRLSKTDNKRNVSVTVAVKKLQPNPSETQREVFDEEAQFMSHIKHPNVLRLLGVCHHDTAFIMMEFTEQGDLNQFLQKYSEIEPSSSSHTHITDSELVYIASQIGSGMQYLAGLKFVHRDLATRSCFVGGNSSIKVGAVGVNTSLYQSSYYHIRGNRMMPIRWMATECFSGKFSEKSDVWAFGVTMWELFTLAKDLPYPHLSDEEVVHNALKREYRQLPVKPAACPQPVYEVMERCWAMDMRHRPTFQNIKKML